MNTHTYEKTYYVGAGETDPSGYCRPSSLQGFLQDAATRHAEILGVSRETLLERAGVFWVLARNWYRLSRPLKYGEAVLVRTWHRGARGAQCYRDFDIEANGVLVGEAVTAWILVDWKTFRITRPSAVPGLDIDGHERAKAIRLEKLPPASDLVCTGSRRALYSDLDVNNHVNNVRYTDFVCDVLALENDRGSWLAELQVGFSAQVKAGEMLRLYTGCLSDGRLYVAGQDEEERVRFDAACRLATAD